MIDFEEFARMSADADLIPVCHRVVADLETPVSVLARLTGEENLFLLESVEPGERFGRYSFIGLHPRGVFTVEEGRPFYADADGRRELPVPGGGAFMALAGVLGTPRVAAVPELPPFFGGAVGYIGYETAGEFETLPVPKAGLRGAGCAFLLTDEVIVFDNVRHTMTLSVAVRPAGYPTLRAAYGDAVGRIAELRRKLECPPVIPACGDCSVPSLCSNMTRDEFIAMVERAKRYIFDGDIIQVVLSQKFSAEIDLSALQLYRALRLVNPSPYTFFLKVGGRVLVGSSPETLVKLEDGTALVRPIAGTRRRGATPTQDRELADELLRDEKERAEHLMLVDLGRNDLGRIALPGSVQVKDFMTVERYSHVMHLVTTVEALPAGGVTAFDLVRSTFPAGTLSGAPKIRAMEIIHELEPEPRGTYGGAVGYFSGNGNMDLAITIRTLELFEGRLSVQAGAGIVSDSDPAAEYEETCNKAAAMIQALKLAAAGLKL